jgi:hypothetical protein
VFQGRRIRELENLISLQRAEISDLQAALRSEREGFSGERERLLDRILALSQPAAYRELHPRPRLREEKPKLRRVPFPGSERSFRPPDPISPVGPDFEADVVVEDHPIGDEKSG